MPTATPKRSLNGLRPVILNGATNASRLPRGWSSPLGTEATTDIVRDESKRCGKSIQPLLRKTWCFFPE
jgi:hypothetical protein